MKWIGNKKTALKRAVNFLAILISLCSCKYEQLYLCYYYDLTCQNQPTINQYINHDFLSDSYIGTYFLLREPASASNTEVKVQPLKSVETTASSV